MLGIAVIAPFVVLQPLDSLTGNDIGPLALHAVRLVATVEINKHPVLSSFGGHFVIVVDHPLVVALHEVDLDSLHAPLFILRQCLIDPVMEALPHHPEYDADILRSSVGTDLFHVKSVSHVKHIANVVPPLVQDHVFNAILRRKVYVMFIGLTIEPCLEVNTKKIIGIVPVPCHLARSDPTEVNTADRRCAKPVDHLAFNQACVIPGDDENPPREGACAGCTCNIILSFRNIDVTVIMSLDCCRKGGE